MTTPAACPCTPDRAYPACCGRFHGGEPAPTAEALMRSRYSAYALGLAEYLLGTWDAAHRPPAIALDAATRWLGLDVRRHAPTGPDTALVEFVARCRTGGAPAVRLHEVSRFVCRDGRWFYVDGDFPERPARR